MTATTQTLAAWLLAQIAADEADVAHVREQAPIEPRGPWELDRARLDWYERHVLAVCEAHRRIVEEYQREEWVIAQGHLTEWTQAGQAARETALRALAAIYADRDGFREEWR